MEFDKLIQARRSVRAYDPEKTIDRTVVEEILKGMQLAPTWKNSQTGRYYVVLSPEKVAQIKQTCLPAFNQKSCKDAPALIVTTFVRDVAGYTEGQPDNEWGNQWGAYDLGMQNAYLCLKASDLGLDTLIMGIRDAGELRRLLEIPETEDVAAVIALGVRDGEPVFRRRKSLEDVARFY